MRHFAYIKYLLRHKARVFLHSCLLGVPSRGALHDLSKLSPVEYFGIGRQFFPSTPQERELNEEMFRQSKLHHFARNQHHFEYWHREDGSSQESPLPVCREIICDWAAVQGCALSVSQVKKLARKSYTNWGKNYRMHPATQQWFLDFLGI